VTFLRAVMPFLAGTSMKRAGLSRSKPSRIAALSAERRVARMRCSVDGVTGRP
jgi:hypothetical protein